jgi:putative hydrolase of the HAD superfamily
MDSQPLRRAFQNAYAYLIDHHQVNTEQQEYEQFLEFYRMLLSEIQYPHLTATLIADLAYNTVYNDEKFCFFDDVFRVLPQLMRRFSLGIVSDTWPSLDRVFRKQNLRHYFSTFVMSCTLGICKPKPQIYEAALEELRVAPHEAIFVDDSLNNVEGAANLGIYGIVIDRYNKHDAMIKFPVITNLYELLEMLVG